MGSKHHTARWTCNIVIAAALAFAMPLSPFAHAAFAAASEADSSGNSTVSTQSDAAEGSSSTDESGSFGGIASDDSGTSGSAGGDASDGADSSIADDDATEEDQISASDLVATKLSASTYIFTSAGHKGYSMAFQGNSIMNSSSAIISKYHKQPGQKWKLKKAEGSYVYLLNAKSSKALTVRNAKHPNGSSLGQAPLKKKSTQKWSIKKNPASADSYYLVPKLSKSLCITASANKTSGAYKLKLKELSGSANQRFTAKKTASYALTRTALIKSLKNAKGSSSITGFGGASFNKRSKAGKRLAKALAAVRRSSSVCAFAMIDLKTGAGISSQANKKVYGASTIKGPYVTAICKYRASSIGSSTKSHINAVAAWSSNSDYKALRSRFGSSPMKSFMNYSGVSEFSSGKTWITYSPKTLGKLWVGSYWANFKTHNKHSAYLRSKYKKGARSFIKSALKSKATTYTKTGWGPFTHSGNIYNDAGIVVKNGHPYVVVVMSKAYYHSSQLKNLVRAIDAYHDYLVS